VKGTALTLQRLLDLTEHIRNCCADPFDRPQDPLVRVLKLSRGTRTLVDHVKLEEVQTLLRDLGTVDVVMHDEGLKSAYYLCTYCKKSQPKLNTCSGCKRAYYCDRVCQKNHWKYHKDECKAAVAAKAASAKSAASK